MSKPKLLLADDSLTIQKLVNLTFADEGFDVVTVGDGDSALREISNEQPDIVLADVHMPGPSGYEICAMMRSIDETVQTPVILLVGSFEPFDPAEADRVGANAYATKPFQSIRQLVEQVNGFLGTADTIETDGSPELEVDAPVAEPVEANDIESLYKQSLAETVEMPAEMAAAMYDVDRLDDEMIETSYSTDQEAVPVEFAITPIDDVDFDNGHSAIGAATETSQESGEDQEEDYPEPVYDDLPSVAEAPPAAMLAPAIHQTPTEEFRPEVRDPFASTAQDFDLDEIDLLDLTPANATQAIAFTTPAAAAEQGSKSQVVSLSPELLDIIVQRVVEKLSEKY